jgi:DNA helicase II / ATP-dependent DNA helicase PcrA
MTRSLEQHLAGLNPAQRQAVQSPIGPVLVRAGAGAGKTRVLALRIAHLVQAERADPRSILAVTFTNKAARELKGRLGELLGAQARGLTTGTFHRVCLGILRERIEGRVDRFTHAFSIYSADDQLALIQRLIDRSELRPPMGAEAGPVLSAISRMKSRMQTPLRAGQAAGSDPLQAYAAAIYRAYQRELASHNALDFDDMLLHTQRLLARDEETLEAYQQRWRHVLVDEYQDTDPCQAAILDLLTGRLDGAPRSLFVVGDVQQAIYQFRNADHRIMAQFTTSYPEARVIELRTNYRSRQEILNAAYAVIQHSRAVRPMPLDAHHTGPRLFPPVVIGAAKDGRAEAEDVARAIVEQVAGGRRYRDAAVLFRTRHMSRELEAACRRHKIPYLVRGTASFYDRRVVRDLLAYLRVLANPADSVSFTRILNTPPRGIGDATQLHLSAVARQLGLSPSEAVLRPEALAGLQPRAQAAVQTFAGQLGRWRRLVDAGYPPAHLIADVLEQTAYLKMLDQQLEAEDRRDADEHLRELQVAADEHTTLAEFVQEVALLTAVEDKEEDRDAVQLLTIHAAKGLEWPVVFVTGLEEGTLPHERSIGDAAALEEERRLCYVAITRAAQQVFLSRAEGRSRGKSLKPSRFLDEIVAYGKQLAARA